MSEDKKWKLNSEHKVKNKPSKYPKRPPQKPPRDDPETALQAPPPGPAGRGRKGTPEERNPFIRDKSESKDGKRWRMTHRTIPFVSTYSVTRVAWFAYKTNTRHINACIFLAPFVAERSCSHLDRRSLHLQRLFAPCSPKYQWPTVACHFHTLRFHSLVYLIIFDICWKLKNVISLRVLGKRRLYVCQNPPNTIAELTFMVSMTFFVTDYNVLQNVHELNLCSVVIQF